MEIENEFVVQGWTKTVEAVYRFSCLFVDDDGGAELYLSFQLLADLSLGNSGTKTCFKGYWDFAHFLVLSALYVTVLPTEDDEVLSIYILK